MKYLDPMIWASYFGFWVVAWLMDIPTREYVNVYGSVSWWDVGREVSGLMVNGRPVRVESVSSDGDGAMRMARCSYQPLHPWMVSLRRDWAKLRRRRV